MSAQRKVIEETICELQETLDLFYQQKSGGGNGRFIYLQGGT